MKFDRERLEEMMEKAKTNVVVISEDEFTMKAAELMSEEPFDTLVKMNPMDMMVLGLFSAGLARKIYHANESESEDKE